MTRLLLTNNTERKQMPERAVVLDGEISRFLALESLNKKHCMKHFIFAGLNKFLFLLQIILILLLSYGC